MMFVLSVLKSLPCIDGPRIGREDESFCEAHQVPSSQAMILNVIGNLLQKMKFMGRVAHLRNIKLIQIPSQRFEDGVFSVE
jgi:hypothetical protein